jgi:hypothetical protein
LQSSAFVCEDFGLFQNSSCDQEKRVKAGQHVVYIFLMSKRAVSVRLDIEHNHLNYGKERQNQENR